MLNILNRKKVKKRISLFQMLHKKYYNDMYCTGNPIDLATLDPWAIYYIRYRRGRVAKKFPNEGYYVEANNDTFAPYTGYAIDGDLKDFSLLDIILLWLLLMMKRLMFLMK